MSSQAVNCIYIRQSEALGLGHAVLCARPVVGDEPFAVLLADDFMDTMQARARCWRRWPIFSIAKAAAFLPCRTCRARKRGNTASSAQRRISRRPGTGRMRIVEKPQPEAAPSTLAVVGRYILTGRIFDYLETIGQGAGGEIQLTDGIAALMRDQKVLAYRYDGQRYDCGSKLGYLKAMVAMGLKHPETRAGFADYLKTMK